MEKHETRVSHLTQLPREWSRTCRLSHKKRSTHTKRQKNTWWWWSKPVKYWFYLKVFYKKGISFCTHWLYLKLPCFSHVLMSGKYHILSSTQLLTSYNTNFFCVYNMSPYNIIIAQPCSVHGVSLLHPCRINAS